MSKILEKDFRKDNFSTNITHIVQTDKGTYYVDSVYVPTVNLYETMVFNYDPVEQEVLNWCAIYCKRYHNFEEMEKKHTEIVNKLEEYV